METYPNFGVDLSSIESGPRWRTARAGVASNRRAPSTSRGRRRWARSPPSGSPSRRHSTEAATAARKIPLIILQGTALMIETNSHIFLLLCCAFHGVIKTLYRMISPIQDVFNMNCTY